MTPTEVRADFPPEASSAGQARRFVDATLRTWNCDALIEVATLLVSELVSNAILHAGTGIRVVLRMHGPRLRVEVHDGNGRLPAQKHYSATSATGRGLLLVERMADDWGVRPAAAGGKSVWFELDSTAAPPMPDVGIFDFTDLDVDGLDDRSVDRPSGEPGGDSSEGRGDNGPRALVPAGRR
jgi:anti-sigma regulatory factor (Ser/Thr protein kinase)